MRLNKNQKELLLEWIAAGLKPAEINERAAKCGEPFKVRRQQVDYYRKQCAVDITELQAQAQFQALNTGLALKEERVQVLRDLADKLIADLNLATKQNKLWVQGRYGEMFNRSEVDALRGLLDDIAKELGHRSIKTDVNINDDGEYRITFVSECTKERDGA